jgi:hypothetical protein
MVPKWTVPMTWNRFLLDFLFRHILYITIVSIQSESSCLLATQDWCVGDRVGCVDGWAADQVL